MWPAGLPRLNFTDLLRQLRDSHVVFIVTFFLIFLVLTAWATNLSWDLATWGSSFITRKSYFIIRIGIGLIPVVIFGFTMSLINLPANFRTISITFFPDGFVAWLESLIDRVFAEADLAFFLIWLFAHLTQEACEGYCAQNNTQHSSLNILTTAPSNDTHYQTTHHKKCRESKWQLIFSGRRDEWRHICLDNWW